MGVEIPTSPDEAIFRVPAHETQTLPVKHSEELAPSPLASDSGDESGSGSMSGEGAVSEDEVDDEELSESLSLLEDVLEEFGDESLFNGEEKETCTLEEAKSYRALLRSLGPEEFCNQTVYNKSISAKKLLTAFGIRAPNFLDDAPDEAFYQLLGLAINRELSKRHRLPEYNTIDHAVELLKKSKNIIVLTGAGISTSLGIPDFRSKDIGLYTKLAHLGLSDPQDVFDIHLFREDPTIFYSIARDILPESSDRYTPTHAFIRLLQEKGKLLTNYTQNIDGIEQLAGISPEKLIQCHGSFHTASCVKCRHKIPGESIFPDLRAGRIPRCEACQRSIDAAEALSTGTKRKRSSNGLVKKRSRRSSPGSNDSDENVDDDIPEAGIMKPDITFFGESLPDSFDRRLNEDKTKADLVIVIGTSLKVAPVSQVVGFMHPEVPQLYISREPVAHIDFDVDMLGDCDVVVAELCRRVGWKLEHEMIPKKQKVEVEAHEALPYRYVFKEVSK